MIKIILVLSQSENNLLWVLAGLGHIKAAVKHFNQLKNFYQILK